MNSEGYSINSSKVYCKLIFILITELLPVVLIVAKCIVNDIPFQNFFDLLKVLIVAKCIVNMIKKAVKKILKLSINSSKVYCK